MFASSMMQELHRKGSESLKVLRKNSVAPHDIKILREWGISDAAEMIGRTPQTIRNLEDSGKLPPSRKKIISKREDRIYTLKEINAIREILNLRPSKPSNANPAIIGIANFKGGVGKSSTSLTLSQAMALLGYRVLLVDSDSQGTSTHLGGGLIPDLHVESKQTLLEVLINPNASIETCIMPTHWDGLDIIPANLSLYNAEMIIPNQIYEYRQKTNKMLPFYTRFVNALDKVKDRYDIILVDTPPSLGFITMNVLYAVDGLIIPLLPAEVDYCSTIQFLGMAEEALSRLPKINYQFIRLLISRHKPASVQAKTMEGAIRNVFGSNVMTNYMIETEAVAKASASMQTIYEAEPHTNEKRTFDRALYHANLVSEEVLLLIKMIWQTKQRVAVKQEPTMEMSNNSEVN